MATRLTGIIYRVASVRRANPGDLIAGIGSQLTCGRWTPPGAFLAVYASRDEATALDEARQQNLRQGVPPWMALPLPLVLTAIEVDLEPVLDLTDGRCARPSASPETGCSGNPGGLLQERGQEALTQGLGRLARDQGFVALLTPSAARSRGTNVVIAIAVTGPGTRAASAARSRGTNVVIYPDRIAAMGRLAIVNPDRLPSRPG